MHVFTGVFLFFFFFLVRIKYSLNRTYGLKIHSVLEVVSKSSDMKLCGIISS